MARTYKRDSKGRFASTGATRGRQIASTRREAPQGVRNAAGTSAALGRPVRGVGGVTASPSGGLSYRGKPVGRAVANKLAEHSQLRSRRRTAAALKSGKLKPNRVERKRVERYAGLR